MIFYATASSDWGPESKYTLQWETCAKPGIDRETHEERRWGQFQDDSSILRAYNRALDMAKTMDHEAIVFLHPDLEIVQPGFGPRCADLFRSDPSIGVIGVIGARMHSGMAWWDGTERFGYQDVPGKPVVFTKGSDNEVDIVDGSIFAVNPSMLEWFRWPEEEYPPPAWHAYPEILCAEAQLHGLRILQIDHATCHHTVPGYAGGKEDWDRLNDLFRRKYGSFLLRRKRP